MDLFRKKEKKLWKRGKIEFLDFNRINELLGTSFNEPLTNDEWSYISSSIELSKEFISEFKEYLNWKNISIFQKLSESFIREFQDYIDWELICVANKLSDNFIFEKFDKLKNYFYKSDNINWNYIIDKNLFSYEEINKLENKIAIKRFNYEVGLTDENLKKSNIDV